ncbi:MAG: cyclase family protein [Acidobacteriota bacterium]|nr:cyclase family protein [Acidobacteriota bacterium]
MKARVLLLLAFSLAAFAQHTPTVVDLTHTLGPKSPDWEGTEKRPFEARDLATFEKDGYFTRYLSMQEHFSTHIDAPAHFSKDGWTVDQIPASHLVAPLIVIDVAKQCAANADYALTVADVAAWEKAHGKIPAGAVVEVRTGWTSKWDSMQDYRNADAKGTMHFPGYSLAAAQFLVEKRGVYGLGIDTLSVDVGLSADYPVHSYTAKHNVYHLENSTNLERVPPKGATVVVGAAKLDGGSGGPVRILALVPR